MSMSTGIRVVAVLLGALMLAAPVLAWTGIGGIHVHPRGEAGRWVVLIVPIVLLATWALAPRALEVGGSELRILRRAWRSAVYPTTRVETVEVLPPRWMLGAWKTAGNGGLFGYYGWFWKKGPVRMFASRGDRLVEVVVEGKRIVLSPDDPERFVEGLLAAAPRARRVGAGTGPVTGTPLR